MLNMLPLPQADRPEASDFRHTPPSPSAMVYTLLRHGRGLSPDEVSRILRQSQEGPPKAA